MRGRVIGHPEVIEDQADITGKFPHFLRYAAHALGFDQADGKAAELGDVFRAEPFTNAATIFIIVPVEDIMATIFDGPVTSLGSTSVPIGISFYTVFILLFFYPPVLSFFKEKSNRVADGIKLLTG